MSILQKFKKKKDETKELPKKEAADNAAKKTEKNEVRDEKKTTEVYALKQESAVKVKKGTKDKNAYRGLLRPVVTEKSAVLADANKYTFEISTSLNKIETSKAIQEVYGVKPKSVHVINVSGKSVRFGRKIGRRKGWRKAIVTLKKGEKIEVYQGT